MKIENDKDVFNLMNYEYDCDIENINVVTMDGRYRVQGDLIIAVRSADDYITRLSHSIESHIYSTINNIVLTRIMSLITSELNLSVRRVFDTIEIMINDKVLYKYTREQILEALVNKLYNLINEYQELLFNDIISFLSNNVNLNITKSYNEIIIENAKMRIVIYVRLEDKFLIEIRISTYYNFENVVNDILTSLQFSRIEANFGRHKVIFESAIPNVLQILTKLNLREITQTIVNVNTLNAILAKDRIIIMHPEHGTKNLTINGIKTVSIDNVQNDLENEINSYNVISLIKQQQQQNS